MADDPGSDVAVVSVLDAPGAPTLVAFGGIAGGMGGMPPFEFFRLAGQLEVNKIFVRDLDQSFYHHGIRGLGASIDEACVGLEQLLPDPRRTVFFGNSAGAYVALILGALIGVRAVHAFAPITTIDPAHRAELRDTRWASHMQRAYAANTAGTHFDARPLLAESTVESHVHYGRLSRLDAAHARRVRARRHAHWTRSHALIRSLRDRGELERIVRQAISC